MPLDFMSCNKGFTTYTRELFHHPVSLQYSLPDVCSDHASTNYIIQLINRACVTHMTQHQNAIMSSAGWNYVLSRTQHAPFHAGITFIPLLCIITGSVSER